MKISSMSYYNDYVKRSDRIGIISIVLNIQNLANFENHSREDQNKFLNFDLYYNEITNDVTFDEIEMILNLIVARFESYNLNDSEIDPVFHVVFAKIISLLINEISNTGPSITVLEQFNQLLSNVMEIYLYIEHSLFVKLMNDNEYAAMTNYLDILHDKMIEAISIMMKFHNNVKVYYPQLLGLRGLHGMNKRIESSSEYNIIFYTVKNLMMTDRIISTSYICKVVNEKIIANMEDNTLLLNIITDILKQSQDLHAHPLVNYEVLNIINDHLRSELTGNKNGELMKLEILYG